MHEWEESDSPFEEYVRQRETQRYEKSLAWRTAIGLQTVDGLEVSPYLIDTAKKHIEGDLTLNEVKALVKQYYETKDVRRQLPERTEEADTVAARITEILSESTFSLSPIEFIAIHRRLFEGVYPLAGQLRDYNITKKEWVLRGETVYYTSAQSLRETLEYDFAQERNYRYSAINTDEALAHILKFISGLWQIHPFGEGNTRTTAVFTIKYLRSFGFKVNNELFAKHSWYFRNALVRANYTNLQQGIIATPIYLERFFRNLLFNETVPLKNREMLVSSPVQSATDPNPKCKNCTLDCTLEELALLQQLKDQPQMTQKRLAEVLGKSERTIKSMTVSLTKRGLLLRKNGRRNGYWEVLLAPHTDTNRPAPLPFL